MPQKIKGLIKANSMFYINLIIATILCLCQIIHNFFKDCTTFAEKQMEVFSFYSPSLSGWGIYE